MSNQKATNPKPYKIPFRAGEVDRFNRFIDATGRKAGPFLRVIAMNSVVSWEESLKDRKGGQNDPAAPLQQEN